MKLTAAKLFVFIAILSIVAFSNVTTAMSQDSGQVIFSSTEIENNFPKSLKFSVHVSSASVIQSAKFFYYSRNEPSVTIVVLEIQASQEMDLTYTWDTSREMAIPSTPVFYYWQVKLDSGETVKSSETLVYYDDIRYDWQIREQGNMAVWWHDRPKSFGEMVFGIADAAMKEQRKLFATELEFPIRLIIYNTGQEFAAWHTLSTDLVGGQAFPRLGITTQIVEDGDWQEEWLMDVVPHELSHMYFFQVTHHPLAITPSWLDEGVAQLNEFSDKTEVLESTKAAIHSGRYLPLWSLAGSFDHTDEEKFALAYDESLSAVTYLVEVYGEEALGRLFAEYKKGNPTEKGFQNVLGISFDEFEQRWLEWLDAPAGTYVPRRQITPRPLILILPGQPTPTPQPTLVASTTPVSTALAALPITPSPELEASESDTYLYGTTFICLAGVCLSVASLAIVLGFVLFKGKRQQRV